MGHFSVDDLLKDDYHSIKWAHNVIVVNDGTPERLFLELINMFTFSGQNGDLPTKGEHVDQLQEQALRGSIIWLDDESRQLQDLKRHGNR